MVLNVMQELTAWLSSLPLSGNLGSELLWKLPVNWTVLAQHIDDPNLLGKVQSSFDSFVQSGQVWALLIGIILGYIIRGLTSYG